MRINEESTYYIIQQFSKLKISQVKRNTTCQSDTQVAKVMNSFHKSRCKCSLHREKTQVDSLKGKKLNETAQRHHFLDFRWKAMKKKHSFIIYSVGRCGIKKSLLDIANRNAMLKIRQVPWYDFLKLFKCRKHNLSSRNHPQRHSSIPKYFMIYCLLK